MRTTGFFSALIAQRITTNSMSNLRSVALQFFDACETGAGWEGCRPYCHANATFSAQADVLSEITTVEAYSG